MFSTKEFLVTVVLLLFLVGNSSAASDISAALQLAEQGDAQAQFNLGLIYYKGEGVRQDKQKAVEWYRKAAEQGDARAQYNLGLMYDKGDGVRQDKQKAVEWLTKAAEQGHARAQCNLGWMYYKGEGVRQDKSAAKEWFGKACDNGFELSCKAYAHLNESGY